MSHRIKKIDEQGESLWIPFPRQRSTQKKIFHIISWSSSFSTVKKQTKSMNIETHIKIKKIEIDDEQEAELASNE